jgi:hypothetical protein
LDKLVEVIEAVETKLLQPSFLFNRSHPADRRPDIQSDGTPFWGGWAGIKSVAAADHGLC